MKSRASALPVWDVATVEVCDVQEAVVARNTSDGFGCGARDSNEAIAVNCSQDARERRAGDFDSAACSIDVSDAATFIQYVRSASWLFRAPLFLFSDHAQLGLQC